MRTLESKTSTLTNGHSISHAPFDPRQAAIVAALRDCPLFAALPYHELKEIAAISFAKTLHKGQNLFVEGGPSQGCYIVQRGAIKIYRSNAQGQERIIRVARQTESFAEEALVSDSAHIVSAYAIEESQLLLVSRTGFQVVLKRQPMLALCLLRSMSEQMRQLITLHDDLTLKDAKTRLANWLLRHSSDPEKREPERIQLLSAKRMLAAELGITSETFSRTLRLFRDQHLIAVGRKTLILLSPFRLKQMLQQNLGVFPAHMEAAFESETRTATHPAVTATSSNGFAFHVSSAAA
jgi:CRP/FNR family transcriptional regulator, dissimilatory nitrate respiration regulator